MKDVEEEKSETKRTQQFLLHKLELGLNWTLEEQFLGVNSTPEHVLGTNV